MMKDKINKILLERADDERSYDWATEQIIQLFLDELPGKKTEGIKGILGTDHRDGVFNEGYNEALAEIREKLKI